MGICQGNIYHFFGSEQRRDRLPAGNVLLPPSRPRFSSAGTLHRAFSPHLSGELNRLIPSYCLSLIKNIFHFEPRRDRTFDPQIKSLLLYQLS